MSDLFNRRLAALSADAQCLRGGRCGIEKESLRVNPDGYISARPHPRAFGSALTNAYITTDYSEALLELVTPPVNSPWAAIQFLCDIHKFVYAGLEDEILWAVSMPCMLRSESDIPLAQYGSSNIGRMKTIYRRGLGHRYGRYMQAISGIHFNYSLPEAFWPVFQDAEKSSAEPGEFRSDAYLGLVRNVRRLDWLLLYLFGASPAVCKSFFKGKAPGLEVLDSGTYYGRHATSLRMSGIGYQNTNQLALSVSANSLSEYIDGLSRAIRTPNPEYEKIGLKTGAEYLQLNANSLQIENEYYSSIRPKRVARSQEHPTEALRRGGVEYIELRALDVSPFDPVGIGQRQVRFLEAFLIYCMLQESPPSGASEQAGNASNHAAVADRGREPGLHLRRDGREVSLEAWGGEICRDMLMVADLLDPDGEQGHADVIRSYADMLEDSSLTPSARLIRDLRETGQSMFHYGMELSRSYADYFNGLEADMTAHQDLLRDESLSSIERQKEIEAADTLSFEEYLGQYFA